MNIDKEIKYKNIENIKKIYEKSRNFLLEYSPHSMRCIPVNAKKPIFILHSGSNIKNGGLYQIEMWIDFLNETGYEYIIVTRHIDVYNALLDKYSNLNISFVNDTENIDNLLDFFSIKFILYVSNSENNVSFLRYNGLKHIYIGHGDSDKQASMHRFFKAYDEIFVSGQAHIDRFLSADFCVKNLIFKIVGRPNIKNHMKSKNKKLKGDKFLYIPTWEGFNNKVNYTSLNIFNEIAILITDKYKIYLDVKIHPITGSIKKSYINNFKKNKNNLLENKKLHFFDKDLRLADIIGNYDFYICDISSTVSEILFLNKPIFVYIPTDEDIEIVSSKVDFDYYTYTFKDIHELESKIEKVLINGNDYLKENREKISDYFVCTNSTLNNSFKKEIDKIIKE